MNYDIPQIFSLSYFVLNIKIDFQHRNERFFASIAIAAFGYVSFLFDAMLKCFTFL